MSLVEELTFIKKCKLDNRLYLMFKDVKNVTRLIEEAGYENYILKKGTIIKAVVHDRGCAGQEITELLHPVYENGKTYQMTIVRTNSFTMNNELVHFMVIADTSGVEYTIRINNGQQYIINNKVLCKLQFQKKGRLSFSLIHS